MYRNKSIKYFSLKRLFIVVIFIFNSAFISAQDESIDNNLEVMFKLIDSSVVKIDTKIPIEEKNIFLNINLPDEYKIFNNRIVGAFTKTNRNILLINSGANFEIQYSVIQAKVNYSDVIKGGLFGEYTVNREILLDSDYSLVNNGKVINSNSFRNYFTDIISYNKLSNLEISNLPFTKAEPPSEPFLSSLVEPVIAVGAAAITVFLFFTIRSK